MAKNSKNRDDIFELKTANRELEAAFAGVDAKGKVIIPFGEYVIESLVIHKPMHLYCAAGSVTLSILNPIRIESVGVTFENIELYNGKAAAVIDYTSATMPKFNNVIIKGRVCSQASWIIPGALQMTVPTNQTGKFNFSIIIPTPATLEIAVANPPYKISIHTLSAGFNTIELEVDPLSTNQIIDAAPMVITEIESGLKRKILVSGFGRDKASIATGGAADSLYSCADLEQLLEFPQASAGNPYRFCARFKEAVHVTKAEGLPDGLAWETESGEFTVAGTPLSTGAARVKLEVQIAQNIFFLASTLTVDATANTSKSVNKKMAPEPVSAAPVVESRVEIISEPQPSPVAPVLVWDSKTELHAIGSRGAIFEHQLRVTIPNGYDKPVFSISGDSGNISLTRDGILRGIIEDADKLITVVVNCKELDLKQEILVRSSLKSTKISQSLLSGDSPFHRSQVSTPQPEDSVAPAKTDKYKLGKAFD